MLTAMTEDDWAIVLQVFRAVRSRRGDKGRDDRKFLEALHYFTVHNITWRALSAEFGHWNSIWKRFWRLSRAGIFEAFFDALAALSESAHLVQMFELHGGARPRLGRGGKGGARRSGARPFAWRLLNQNPLPIRLSPTATSGSVRPCSWTFTSVAIFGSHNRSQSSSDFFPTTRPAPPTWRRLAGATGLFAPIVSRGVSANHPSRLRKPENVAERHPSRGQSPAPASLPQRIHLPFQQAVLSVQRLPFPARHRGRRHRTLPTQSFTPEPGSILHVGGVGNNRIGNQNPPQGRPRRLAARLPSDWGRSQRQPQLRTPARHRTRYFAARRHHRQRLRRQIQSRRRPQARHLSGHSASRDCNRQTRFLPENPLQSAGAHRAGRRQTQALQAHRTSLREDCAQLRFLRRARPRPHLDQIRPHGLGRGPRGSRRRCRRSSKDEGSWSGDRFETVDAYREVRVVAALGEFLCIDSPSGGLAMPKAYSGDLRERVIEAVETGASRREAAERFEASVSSAVKWLQRWRERKSAAPKPRGGSISPLEELAPSGARHSGGDRESAGDTSLFAEVLARPQSNRDALPLLSG